MEVRRIDHLVLTVHDVNETLEFYEKVLGVKPVNFGAGRIALKFGDQPCFKRALSLMEDGRPTYIFFDFTRERVLKDSEIVSHIDGFPPAWG